MLLLFSVFLILLLLNIPIVVVIGISSLAYLFLNDIPPLLIGQRITTSLLSFPLLAIPFFILLAEVLNHGGATQRLMRLVVSIVGFIRGGLGLANVGISMLFSGISGTALADTSGLGSTLIPSMKKQGYSSKYAAAVTAASSTVGPIIPPSVPLIIAGVIAGLSIYDLFLAGAIPGLLMGFAMMVTAYIIALKRKYPRSNRFETKEVWASLKGCIWEISLIIFILYGILGGVFTATEAGAMGVIYALFLGFVVRRELTFKKLYRACVETTALSGIVLIIVGFASTFGWIIAMERFPELFSEWILAITVVPILALLLVNLVLLVIGAVMETTAALIIVLPTLLLLGSSIGVDPIQMTIIVVLNLILGLLTPPIGMALYIVSSISKEKIGAIVKEVFPFFIANLFVLLLVIMFPKISLWLPTLLNR
ncbi:TRAP-type C4-dicarboxylate transport system [Halalkalibacter wakoensis JCM 9140]|uniref:TRAP-type C4-dicarboxylate transport system n=1 Tax=Halalkalibacter wakoensis JCM 9140 TaxID=1236970 RepID=W4Q6Z5_9BACI|nr:TRAP transporter large permease [Halalkalibacter wakoensis]GAE27740.1 TRAP-type C4-dicarboxylate transport system [Halalkalibacter wakoensis JCM 9140]